MGWKESWSSRMVDAQDKADKKGISSWNFGGTSQMLLLALFFKYYTINTKLWTQIFNSQNLVTFVQFQIHVRGIFLGKKTITKAPFVLEIVTKQRIPRLVLCLDRRAVVCGIAVIRGDFRLSQIGNKHFNTNPREFRNQIIIPIS